MIITISQTASNVKQSYEVESEHGRYHGEAGSVSRLQSVTLSDKDTTLKGVYSLSSWVHYIPLRYLFGKENRTRVFHLYKNDRPYGRFAYSKHGLFKSCYEITTESGDVVRCYGLSRGAYHYVSVYSGDTQIALMETCLSTEDVRYIHTLYLSEEAASFAEILSLFAVYYASYTFAKRLHMSSGSESVRAWSFSRYADKYDPQWRAKHCPDKCRLGETRLFRDTEEDA
ncbi:MAG: hypothetical protein IJD01_08485 [Clostridia bacterium]|nr:hypothetical protein [Clostridia bacterium]